MNKILSIIAICAIFSSAAAWSNTPVQILTAAENLVFGSSILARYSDDSRSVLIGYNQPSGNITTTAVTRRFLNATNFAKYNATAQDDSYAVSLPNCTVRKAYYSQDGYVALGCDGANVYLLIFKSDANLTVNTSITTTAGLAVAAAGATFTIDDLYFQDDYFYVTFFTTTTTTGTTPTTSSNIYIQGVKAKDATLLSTAAVLINTNPLVNGTASAADCNQRPGAGVQAFCAYADATTVKAKSIAFTGTSGSDISLQAANANTDFIAVSANTYYAGLAVTTDPTSKANTYYIAYDSSTTSTVANGTTPLATGAIDLLLGLPYFDNFFILTSDVPTTGLTTLSYATGAKNTTDNTTSFNATTSLGQGTYVNIFTQSDSSFYVIFVDANNNTNVGQVFNQTSNTKFATALKSIVASIFVAGALLFAF